MDLISPRAQVSPRGDVRADRTTTIRSSPSKSKSAGGVPQQKFEELQTRATELQLTIDGLEKVGKFGAGRVHSPNWRWACVHSPQPYLD